MTKIESLAMWREKYGQEAPNPATVSAAKNWMCGLYSDTLLTGTWAEPNITVSSDADIVFEWWSGDKKLTVYVSEQGAEYIKVWGIDILNEMEDGNAQDSTVRRELWSWLIG